MRKSNPFIEILSPGIYAAVIILILALTGVFATFSGSDVVKNTLSLNQVTLVLMLTGSGFATAWRSRDQNALITLLAGAAGGLISGAVLALLVVINISLNMSEIFVNIGSLNESIVTFDRVVDLGEGKIEGLLLLLGYSALLGAVAGLMVIVSQALQTYGRQGAGALVKIAAHLGDHLLLSLVVSALIVMVLGLTFDQIDDIMTLPDALSFVVVFGLAYVVTWLLIRVPASGTFWLRLVSGAAIGLIAGGILWFIVDNGGLNRDTDLRDVPALPTTYTTTLDLRGNPLALYRQQTLGVLRGTGDKPEILAMPEDGNGVWLVSLLGVVGAAGAAAATGSMLINNGALYFLVSLLSLGVLNWQGDMTLLAAEIIFMLFVLLLLGAPMTGHIAQRKFDDAPERDRQTARLLFTMLSLGVLAVAPQFVNLYISNVFNWIALYIIMGLGLNVMIGFTGLLDLGYVASFAIGAYTLGILTAPNILTCGGTSPADIPFNELEQVCTGTLTFWQAWPICVIVSASTGMLLGVPVLGLRGDYLAIVTLGFGEITNRIIKADATKDYLGGAQGIKPIPTPEINLSTISDSLVYSLDNSSTIFYLYLFSVCVTAFIIWRLSRSRLGRAWRAIRADEDVAEAMGIHLVKYKLLAFGVSSAFAGLGGAVFGVQLRGIFPDSFTILVSINVLSLIIMGGMGSLAGVALGAVVLVGLPELLRELGPYRLMGYGVLLVIVMLTKPEGLLPPKPAELSERANRERERGVRASSGVLAKARGAAVPASGGGND